MTFAVDDELIAAWTPAHEDQPRHLAVKVLELIPQVGGTGEQTYRVQTNMGVTMVFKESDLGRPN